MFVVNRCKFGHGLQLLVHSCSVATTHIELLRTQGHMILVPIQRLLGSVVTDAIKYGSFGTLKRAISHPDIRVKHCA
jgi:hypothetical protein